MPKLLFTPKFHTIGDNEDIFCTSCKQDDPVIFIKCNDIAKFIINQMYPEHKPRTEIVPLVMEEFGCTQAEANEAVQTVVLALIGNGEADTDE